MATQGETGFASETIAVKAAHRFDERRLEEYLEAHLTGFSGPLTVKQFEGGQSNPTYFLATPGRNYVLRRKPPGDFRHRRQQGQTAAAVCHRLVGDAGRAAGDQVATPIDQLGADHEISRTS